MHPWTAMLMVMAMLEVASAQDMRQTEKTELAVLADTVVVVASLGNHLPQTWPGNPCDFALNSYSSLMASS